MIAAPQLSKSELRRLVSQTIAPATISEMIFCDLITRAIVLVSQKDFTPELGNAKHFAKECCGWDVCIMTRQQLELRIELAVRRFTSLHGMTTCVAECAVGEGVLSFTDLAQFPAEKLVEMTTLTIEQTRHILDQARLRAPDPEEGDEDYTNRYNT